MMPGGGWNNVFGGSGMGGGGGFPPPNFLQHRRFEEQYHCYSVAFADKAHLEKGDKVLLPPSAFDTLARLQVDYPMLFRLTNPHNSQQTHCGVLEFTAEEGCVYIPFWMMQNLLIEEGALLTVTNVSLPKATFVKLQPQSVDFLEISNPRAVLEHALRNFSCVTVNDIIQIPYNSKNYHFALKEVKPSPAACIIETDCQVDFDAPLGYQEPNYTASQTQSQRSSACPSPATTMSGASIMDGTSQVDGMDTKPPAVRKSGVRIVDGVVIRDTDGDNEHDSVASSKDKAVPLLAERVGATGVQPTAAMLASTQADAPPVDYWAVVAGDGSRLDGKSVPALKDASGNELDVRQLRAQAAAQRAEAAAKAAAANAMTAPSSGKTLQGTEVTIVDDDGKDGGASNNAAVVSKRKSRVAGKYSKLKQSGTVAFQGSAHAVQPHNRPPLQPPPK